MAVCLHSRVKLSISLSAIQHALSNILLTLLELSIVVGSHAVELILHAQLLSLIIQARSAS